MSLDRRASLWKTYGYTSIVIMIVCATASLPTALSADTTQIWQPALKTTWQYQFTTPVDQSVNADVYVIDLFDNSASVVASLHAQGRKVVCYMNAGAWESWRPDANQFPGDVVGNGNGWPGERWLDIRNLSELAPIILARMDLCKAKGFDGIDPDNVDGYSNNTGFDLSYDDQIAFNTFLATAAQARGLAVGLKNDLDQVQDLVPLFQWAINEQCFQYDECDSLTPFVTAGKPVFNVEYQGSLSDFCPQAQALQFNSIKKHLNLDAYLESCSTADAGDTPPSSNR